MNGYGSREILPLNGQPRPSPLAPVSPAGDRRAGVADDSPPTDPQDARADIPEAPPLQSPADYPMPRALRHPEALDWHEDAPLAENYAALGRALAAAGDLYRNPAYASGLLLAPPDPHVPPTPIADAGRLAAILADRVPVRVLKEGKVKGMAVPRGHLKTMLASEAFLRQFRPVDAVDAGSRYLPDFTATRPGHNDGGFGQRILHLGAEPRVEWGHDAIARFLDVMAFATEADRTNAVAAALTVLLRHLWPGEKPCLVVTSTKSHGGKETVVRFAAGTTRHVSISYEAADWSLEKAFVAAVKHEPEVGLVDVENARLGPGQASIRSAFLERFLTDPEPLLFSSGTGGPVRRRNDIVVAVTTNDASVIGDLMNRALPIHLAPFGDVAARSSPIGNPKLEYLPAHSERIAAELRGTVELWMAEGRPLDLEAKHPFGPWAQTIGGILRVAGFASFLANYAARTTADDPVRKALAVLGAARPDAWLRTAEWAGLVARLGLVKALIPEADRDSDAGRLRGLGVVFSDHERETFHAEDEDRRSVLVLEKCRRRFDGEPQRRYRFRVLEAAEIPADAPPAGEAAGHEEIAADS